MRWRGADAIADRVAMRATPHRSCARIRAGLTVVEVLVALLVVSVGLLAMAGTSTLALRSASFAARERRALGRLQLRLATLAATGCEGASSGTGAESGDGVREQWTVAPPQGGAALVDASVEWRDGTGTRAMTGRSAILCR